MKKTKIYGYIVGYRELGSRFVRYYTTFTHKNALSCLYAYRKFPPRERETNRPLIDPVWEIQPITKKEILRSILDEIPFPRKNATYMVTPFVIHGLLSIAIILHIAFFLPPNANLRLQPLHP